MSSKHTFSRIQVWACLLCLTSYAAYGQYLTVNGPVHTSGTATLNLQNMHLNVDEDGSMPGTGTWRFSGTQPIMLFNAGAAETSLPVVQIRNTEGIQLMDSDLRIRQHMQLGNGIVHSGVHRVIFSSGSTVGGARAISHVDGTVAKEGNTPFEFPTGANGHFQPLALVNMSGGPSTFEARYVDDTHPNPQGPWHDGNQWPVSTCDYWELERSAGNAQAQVQLTWVNSPCSEVNDPQHMRVARYSAGAWELLPSDTFDPITETVLTDAQESAFGNFALASIGGGINVLPIALLEFKALHLPAEGVRCSWRTASETNNAFFTLSRSTDGQHWEALEQIRGAGYSSIALHYSYTDAQPLAGTSYYRLSQTDYDGSTEIFDPVAVYIPTQGSALQLLKSYRQGEALRLHIQAAEGSIRAEVYDLPGKLLHRTQLSKHDASLQLPGGLPQGVYILRLEQSGEVVAGKFFW